VRYRWGLAITQAGLPLLARETLRVLKNNEIRQFVEYRMQRLLLEARNRLLGVE
jgi:hypothetical protein